MPYPDVLSEEQREDLAVLLQSAGRFLDERNDAQHNDEKEEIPAHVLQGLKDLGSFGLQVPEAYGGLGLSNTEYARLSEAVGARDLGVLITIGAHQSIGFKGKCGLVAALGLVSALTGAASRYYSCWDG